MVKFSNLEYRAVMSQLVIDLRVSEQSLSDCRRRADLADQEAMAKAKADGIVKMMQLLTAHQKSTVGDHHGQG